MTVLTAVTDALKYLWEYHDQIGIFLTLVVFAWVGLSKEKRAELGAKLPRLAHTLDFMSAIGMNIIEAKRQIPLIKAGTPYLPPRPPENPPTT